MCEKLDSEFDVKCEDSRNTLGMLSGGNMQKVIAAREAFRSVFPDCRPAVPRIDVGATNSFIRKFWLCVIKGAAVLLVSADLNEVMELSDSLMVMYDGEIVAYFPDASRWKKESWEAICWG